MASRFEKLSKKARIALAQAQDEAQRFNHNYIGPEHILLGLLRDLDCVATKVLLNLYQDLNKIRSSVEYIIGRGEHLGPGTLGLTPRAQKVIELAIDEARQHNSPYIGTEHLLVGLMREGEGIASGVLSSLNITVEQIRQGIERIPPWNRRDWEGLSSQVQEGVKHPAVSDQELERAVRHAEEELPALMTTLKKWAPGATQNLKKRLRMQN